jgi:hypothetical protein
MARLKGVFSVSKAAEKTDFIENVLSDDQLKTVRSKI